jgi:hypothetical protein
MPAKPRSPSRVPRAPKGTYADGHPLDRVEYVESKIILKPDRFTSRKSFWEFARIVKKVARKTGVGFSSGAFKEERPQIREVVFLDTADFRLYNNAFILRRRIPYRDGFPIGDPEIVFKFRHPELDESARTDVRPRIEGGYRIKFKAEALPRKDAVGTLRLLYSHNVEFPLSHVHEGDRLSMENVVRVLPALARLRGRKGERLELVNHTIVEEVLQDVGMLDFGKGIEAKANVSLWRTRGDHLPLVGEFAFQIRLKRDSTPHDKVRRRVEQFFVSLQYAASTWLLLGATKTGMVYRLHGNPPQAHE